MTDRIYPGLKRIPTTDDIVKAVSGVTGVTFDQARLKCRKREVVFFRYAYWHFVKKYYNSTLKELADPLLKTHASVIFGLNACKNLSDSRLQKVLKKVNKKLRTKVEYK